MSSLKDVSTRSHNLDSLDYDPTEHLNALFSHPSTLSSAAATSDAIERYQNDLEVEIARLVASQSESEVRSVKQIQLAKSELADLFRKIDNVRERAVQTERSITDMTADIKRLDGTKKNLTLSMTALKRLQMLTTAYEQLLSLSKTRQYGECAQLLQAVIQLMAHFKSYRSIDQIATLSRNVADLQRELLEQVCEDFELTFARSEVSQRRATLNEACLVMDALGDNARSRLITWYCNTQLREYRQVFRGNDEAGSLDNISRRYSWFKRMMATYDEEHVFIFPAYWRVNEALANVFCEGTRDDFKSILSRSMRRVDGQTLDVDLLLSCLRETLEFEQELERKFVTDTRGSIDTVSSRGETTPAFGRAISEAFEPYLSLWVESQDKQLGIMIQRYRQQPLLSPEEEFSPQAVLPSSMELFHFYRSTLAQCAKLSTGNRLLELSRTFAKYLDEYAERVLLHFLRDQIGTSGLSTEDVVMVLNTADYCHTTCTQLEEKIKGRIDENLRSSVDLQSQADTFMGVASAALRSLVRKVETDCESGWREMRNTPWSKLSSVGDQSSYVAELINNIKNTSGEILKLLIKPQYARAFCDNLVELMANTYISNIVQCRPISEVGAEQMLLDSYVLKKGFEGLLTNSEDSSSSAPSGFLKRVQQSMSKIDPLVKTLQVRSSPPEGLVQAYIIHIGDQSDTNFRKVLDLKGVRKQDQPHLVELFQVHRATHDNLVQSSTLLTPLQIGSSNVGSIGHAGTLSTPSLPARFDASTFGSAIMSAARDGVDRLGTPTIGGNTPQGLLSPAPGGETNATANLNENLRNIGKFFRRDMGSFGSKWGNKASDDVIR